jgi:hypothetical protein
VAKLVLSKREVWDENAEKIYFAVLFFGDNKRFIATTFFKNLIRKDRANWLSFLVNPSLQVERK